ncbi:MAG: trypsin-like peptidase domain-containing protein [Acidimicrobiales bacterium]|nr:trypsin-like peptidase domain-containing protein [Acidimicrobiales bacterium]
MGVLGELEAVAGRLAASVGPSVVRVGRDLGRGAGIVLGPGVVLTSAHNLRGQEVTVTFPGGRRVVGEVKGVDAEGDVAVVAADTGPGTASIEWAEAAPALGQAVFSVGSIPGSGSPRVTLGAVSAVGVAFRGPTGRLIADGFEHTAMVGRGSSGGPVVDGEGRLVGINTHRPGDGFYLAIPASGALRARAEALARGESPARRRLGIALTPSHVAARLRSAVGLPPRPGLLVRDVAPETPAAAAGIQRGDLIVAAGGSPVESLDGLLAAVDSVGPDGRLTLAVVRGAEELAVDVVFAA